MLLWDSGNHKLSVPCADVSLAELAEKLLENWEGVLMNIRRSTGEVLLCPYQGRPDWRKKLSNQPLWVQYQRDDDIIQFGTYFFNNAGTSLEGYAKTLQPPEGEFDENWRDDSAYSRLMRAIWEDSDAGFARVLRTMDELDLWGGYSLFCAKRNWEYSKKLLDDFAIPYVDDRPPLEDFLEKAKSNENYDLLERKLKESMPDYAYADYETRDFMEDLFGGHDDWW